MTLFTFISGSNPYITITEKSRRNMLARCRRRGWTATRNKSTDIRHYIINDTITNGGKI